MLSKTYLATALFALATHAQTTTDCNPMEKDCGPQPALGTTFNQTFGSHSELDTDLWNITAKSPSFSDEGMTFVLERQGESVNVKSNFYIFWGTYEMIAKMSPGAGLISTSVLLSETLDEIDWEVIGNNGSTVQTNYYGKGDREQMNGDHYPSGATSPQGDFHNYTMNWTKEKLEWIFDGNIVRTLKYEDALEGGKLYPQSPMHVNMGLWSAGDSDNKWTVEWAGGETDWNATPYVMTIKSIKVVDGTPNATSYVYGDRSGSWESIEVKKEGKSRAAEVVEKPPSKSVSQHFEEMPQGSKLAIIITPLAILAIGIIIGCFCCVKQRKLGIRERALEDAQWEKENAEMMAYRQKMASGAFSRGSQYQPAPTSVPSPRPF